MRPHIDHWQSQIVATYERHVLPMAIVASDTIQSKSAQLWLACQPVVNEAVARATVAMKYGRTKLDETFPTLLEQTAELLHSVTQRVVRLCDGARDYLASREFRDLVTMATEKAEFAYRYAVNYTRSLVGAAN